MTDWTIIVPIKPAAIGKSRLVDAAADRTALARAIALDTVEVACSVASVVVVTDDAEVAAEAIALGARVVGEGPGGGLNGALAHGASTVSGFKAALLGDLPSLQASDLAAALLAAAVVDRACVADADGVGTTLVTARGGIPLVTAFGEGSYAKHLALGCVALNTGATLRRDVDTAADLAEASALGLGPRTRDVLGA